MFRLLQQGCSKWWGIPHSLLLWRIGQSLDAELQTIPWGTKTQPTANTLAVRLTVAPGSADLGRDHVPGSLQ